MNTISLLKFMQMERSKFDLKARFAKNKNKKFKLHSI